MAEHDSDVKSSIPRVIVLTLMLISALALFNYSLSRPNQLRNWLNGAKPAASTESKQKNVRSSPVAAYYARSDLPVYKDQNFGEEIMTLARGSRVTGILMPQKSKSDGKFLMLDGMPGFVEFKKLSGISRPLIENSRSKISIVNNVVYEEPDLNSRKTTIKDGDEVKISGFVSDKNIFQEVTVNQNLTAYVKTSDLEDRKKYVDSYYFEYILKSNLSQEIAKNIIKLEPNKKIDIDKIGKLPILTAYLHMDSDDEGGDGFFSLRCRSVPKRLKKS